MGHLLPRCATSRKRYAHSTRYFEDVSQFYTADDKICDLGLYTFTSKNQRGSVYQVHLLLERKPVKMEMDTGSAVFIVSERVYKNYFSMCH